MKWRQAHDARSATTVKASGSAAAIAGDVYGVVSTGRDAINVVIQDSRGVTELRPLDALHYNGGRSLQPRAEPLIGRDDVIEQVAADLRAGRSVQLHGPPGVGKKAIARAAIRTLAADGEVRGAEILRYSDGRPHTLHSVYRDLTGALFGQTAEAISEELLRRGAADVAALIFIGDSGLSATDINRLLNTFPRCVFLFTSPYPAIGPSGASYEIPALALDDAIALIGHQAGNIEDALDRLRVEEAYRLAEGRVQRLIQYGAFIRRVLEVENTPDLWRTDVSPQAVAALLFAGLSEPACRVLVALATFQADIRPEHFEAVTGLSESGNEAARIGKEILDAGLVEEIGPAYRITADAAHAVRSSNWPPALPGVAALGVLPLLTNGQARSAPFDPLLLVAVARGLADADENPLATRFIRAAIPVVLSARHTQVWGQLLALGIRASLASRNQDELGYFLAEEHKRATLTGDKAAVAAALADLLDHQRSAGAQRNHSSHGRRLLRHGHRALAAGHGAGAVGVAAVAVAVTVTAVYAASGASGRPRQPEATRSAQARPVAAALAGPGTACGSPRTKYSPGTQQVVVTQGHIGCSTAVQVISAYYAAASATTEEQTGSGGIMTVNGWSCGHTSVAGTEATGVYATCSRAGVAVESKTR